MAMMLTSEEEAILSGKQGEAKKIALELLVRVGELFGADRLIPVRFVHVHAHYGGLHDAGMEVAERFAGLGARYSVPTTVNPSSISAEETELPVPPEYAAKQRRIRIAHEVMGVIPTWSCCPYYETLPALGENVAWGESSAISFANSVLGARTNKTSTGLEISASLLGKMPEFGLYLPENRQPQIRVDLRLKHLEDLDFHTLGFILGKLCKKRIPWIRGMPAPVSQDSLKALGASAASSGAVELYHVEGITAEAKAGLVRAERNDWLEHFTLTEEDLKETQEKISTASGEVDLITIGCPHYSVSEMSQVAKLLAGKKVSGKIPLWVYTSSRIKAICRGQGILKTLEEAGVRVVSGSCPVISPLRLLGIKAVMVNSGKLANVIPSEHDIEVVYASTEECIRTAILGRRA